MFRSNRSGSFYPAEESLNDPEGLFGGPLPSPLPRGQRALVYPEFPGHLPLRKRHGDPAGSEAGAQEERQNPRPADADGLPLARLPVPDAGPVHSKKLCHPALGDPQGLTNRSQTIAQGCPRIVGSVAQ